MKKVIIFSPIIILLIISFFLFFFLLKDKDPSKPPSALLDENVPNFSMINLYNKDDILKDTDLKNKTTLINFFASWCIPCKAEHPLFFEIKKKYPSLFILGIDMQDNDIDAIEFLSNDGNPYNYVAVDKHGFVGIEFGVVGLPETFLVNSNGKIIYKYLGPLTKEILKNEIEPLL